MKKLLLIPLLLLTVLSMAACGGGDDEPFRPGLRTHNTGVQPCRGRDELEHRAGHIQLGNVLILPLGLAHHTLQLGSLAGDLLALLVRRLFMADDSVCNDVLDGLLVSTGEPPTTIVPTFLFFNCSPRQ